MWIRDGCVCGALVQGKQSREAWDHERVATLSVVASAVRGLAEPCTRAPPQSLVSLCCTVTSLLSCTFLPMASPNQVTALVRSFYAQRRARLSPTDLRAIAPICCE